MSGGPADIYDAVVVGAGCSGCVVASRLSASGFRVLLLERKREEELGQDTCDMVEVDAFVESGVAPPAPPELKKAPDSVEVVGPDYETRINLQSPPFMIVDRRLLGSRLLAEAREAGVEVKTSCTVDGLRIENGRVVAVNSDRGEFRCAVAVEASGLDRVLCTELPTGMGIPRRLRSSDFATVYEESRGVSGDYPDGAREGLLEYYIGRYGGYSWVFCDGDRFHIGTAVQDAAGNPDPREIVLGYVRSNPPVGESTMQRAGGRVPMRRPLDTMVASGMMVVGDAACQASPVSGRGVGGALTGAATAAGAASEALGANSTGIEDLWSYNHEYMSNRGANSASLDCLRIFLQRIGEKDFAWSMARDVIGRQEISAALSGRFEAPGVQNRLKKLITGLKSVPLLVRFENALRLAQRVEELYRQYPREYDPPEFDEWSSEVRYLFEDVEKL